MSKIFNEVMFRRFMSLLLCICMVLPLCVSAAETTEPAGSGTVVNNQTNQTELNASTDDALLYTVIAGSDYQYDGTYSPAELSKTVSSILNQIKEAGHSTVDGFLFAGDYAAAIGDAGSSTAGKEKLVDAVNAVYPGLADGDTAVYVQGNHEPDNMDGLTTSGEHDAEGYGVYVINEKDYMWNNNGEATIQTTAKSLEMYLNAKIEDTDWDRKPIFVVSHLPLHYNMRTKNDGDGMYANYIFDVLNAAGAKGLNIIFLFGHDHSNGWDDYLGGSAIYLERGDSINIAQESQTEFATKTLNFTYVNAGYVGYYAGVNDGSETDLTMTVFEIYENEVVIQRYSAEGLHDLKSAGVTNSHKSESGYSPDTRVYGSPQMVGLNTMGYDSNTGVTVSANGIGDVMVTKGTSAMPSGYTGYQTYDIKVEGFKEGTEATVTIPVTGFDTTKPTVVIDHERNRIIPVEIVNGVVTFTTDHFSLYTVAQESTTTYSADGIVKDYLEQVTSITAGEYYAITTYLKRWVLTGTATTANSGSNALLLEDKPISNKELWYYDGTYLRYGDTEKYLMMSWPTALIEEVTTSNKKRRVSNIFLNDDGLTFSLERTSNAFFLHQISEDSTAAIASQSNGNASDLSKWYFYGQVDGIPASLSVTPDRGSVVAGKTITLNATATVNGEGTDDLVVTYTSSDPSVAVVSSAGVVTGYKTGRVTITATLTSAGGYDMATPAVVEIPLSVVTVTKNEYLVTGSGTIGQYLVPATSETLKTNTPYVITHHDTGRIMTGNQIAGYNSRKGLSLVEGKDFSHTWYYDGTHLLYGSATASDNYLVWAAVNDVKVGTGTDDQIKTNVVLRDDSTYLIKNNTGSWALNRYGGGTTWYTACAYEGVDNGSRWDFNEVVAADATLTLNFPKSSLKTEQTMSVAHTVHVNGNLVQANADYEVSFTSSKPDVATVSMTEKYEVKVTAVKAGTTTITATLTSAEGYTLDIPAVVEFPLTVTADEVNTDSVTASTVVGDFLGQDAVLPTNSISGPYVIFARERDDLHGDVHGDVLTGNKNVTSSNVTSSNVTGLGMVAENDFSHLWYFDGTHLLYNSPTGTDNYLACDKNKQVTLAEEGADGVTVFNKITQYDTTNVTLYNISSDGLTGNAVYLNQLGGKGHTAVGLYASDFHSRWMFAPAYKNADVTLSVTPNDGGLLFAGESVTLTPTVWLEGKDVSTDCTIVWTSSNTSVATVSGSTVTGQPAGGHVVITATLTHIGGVELPTKVSVEIPVQVVKTTTEGTSITASFDTEPAITPVSSLQAGVPYVITNYDNNKVLTGYLINTTYMLGTDTNHTDTNHREGLGLTAFNDMSHMWYYNGTNLQYGDPNGTDNYLSMYPGGTNYIRLRALGTDEYFPIDTVTPDADTSPTYNISASEGGKYKYMNRTYGPAHNNVAGYTETDIGSQWLFNTIVPGTNNALTVSPASSSVKVGSSIQFNDLVTIDGIEVYSSRVVWTSLNPEIATVDDGVVTGVKGGTATIRAKLTHINGELQDTQLYVDVTVQVVGVKNYRISGKEGIVAQRSGGSSHIGESLTITYFDGTVETIPVTVSMLRDSAGKRISTYGDTEQFTNLQVVYGGYIVCTDMVLNVILRDASDYPAYPEEGSVIVDKTGVGIDFQSSGIAQIELSTTGIPARKGADVIIMLDTSSSMDYDRMTALTDSLNDMVSTLQRDGADGNPMDFRIAVANFNAYFADSNSHYYLGRNDTTKDNSIRSGSGFENVSKLCVYTGNKTISAGGFISVHDMQKNPFYFEGVGGKNYDGTTSNVYKILTQSGTNYDYAFDVIYQLGSAVKTANAANNEDRDLFVIFMSDGAPFQYNYFSSQSGGDAAVYWNNWLTGTMNKDMFGTDYKEDPTTGARNDYYNEDGLNWMAEAIKGTPGTDYPVIRKNDDRDTDKDNWITLDGLGATMYSIGFCLEVDRQITVDTMQTVIRNVASRSDLYFDADVDTLSHAFDAITNEICYAATNARFMDQMGEDYDLLLKTSNYVDTSNSSKSIVPEINVKEYTIYTHQDVLAGLCERDQVGTRKLDVSGNEICKLLETVTFATVDGTVQAYSNVLGSSNNILVNGVICANTFWYNTTDVVVKIDADGDSVTEFDLDPETFYWKVGTISTTELTLSYYVYLTGSMEGTRGAGIYDTNEHAELCYVNYRGADCKQSVPTPKLPWQQARVGYGFYLVDKNGNPIVNQISGETGSFGPTTVRITQPVYDVYLLNSGKLEIDASILAMAKLPEGYALFDSGAEYAVVLNSNGSGSYTISSDVKKQTTYVEGLSTNAVTNTADKIGATVTTDSFATANTVVWFAVRSTIAAAPDTVVIDYGLPVEIDVAANDILFGDTGTLNYVACYNNSVITNGYIAWLMEDGNHGKELWQYLQTLNPSDTSPISGTSANGVYGKLSVVEGTNKVRYVPNRKAMQMSEEDTFVYALRYNGTVKSEVGMHYSTVTIIPATTIYFEDNSTGMVKYEGFTYDLTTVPNANNSNLGIPSLGNTWEPVGTSRSADQAQDRPGEYSFPGVDANNIYGYDGAYTTMAQYSMGSAMKFTASQDGDILTYGTATFTFSGTGFDVISLTSGDTGTITVEVFQLDSEGNYVAVDNGLPVAHTVKVVNTYYGYQYVDGKWQVNQTASDTLYQVPVMKISSLPYGTYQVVITLSYNEFFDRRKDGAYDFYLDAIRIYDPANDGEDNDTIKDAYVNDGEGWPEYFELRNLIISRNDLDYNKGSTVVKNGIVFIDGSSAEADVADYMNYGPNNELYLAPGQTIAFDLNVPGDNVAAIHMAVKSVGGTASPVCYDFDDETKTSVLPAQIATATDLYYDITNLNGKTVVITNTSGSVLSITNLKVTYTSEHTDSLQQTYLSVAGDKIHKILDSLNTTEEGDYDTNKKTGIVVKSASLSLEDEVLVNFYFQIVDTAVLKAADVVEMGLLGFDSREDAEKAGQINPGFTPYELAKYVSNGARYDAVKDRYMVQTPGIAAKDMGDDLFVRVYVRAKNGQYWVSEIVTYSPKTYAYSRIEKSDSKEMKALCVALLNYGAEAQKYFAETSDYTYTELMNADLTAAQQALVETYSTDLLETPTDVDNRKVGAFAATDGFGKNRTASVSFDGALALNYYFPIADGIEVDGNVTFYYWSEEAYNNAETLTAGNATSTTSMVLAPDGRYWAQVGGFAAKEMDETAYVAVVYSDEDGNQYCSGVNAYSISKYCSKLFNDKTEGALVKAAAVYGYHADQYFTPAN